MKNSIINFSFMFGILTILVGCGFDPSNRGVVFFTNGEAYHIPYNSRYRYIDSNLAEYLKSIGINCPAGQVLWHDASIDENSITDDELRDIFSKNLAGCSNPLSQAELNYIQHREMIREQQNMNTLNQLNQQRQMNRMNQNLQNLRNYNFLKLY